MGNVVILSKCLIIQKLLLDLSINISDFLVDSSFFSWQLLDFLPHFEDLPLHLGVLVSSYPLYRVLLHFLDVIDTLKNISNIVDSTLLNTQHIHCLIKIDGRIFAVFDQFNEFFGEDRQRVVLPTTTCIEDKLRLGVGSSSSSSYCAPSSTLTDVFATVFCLLLIDTI